MKEKLQDQFLKGIKIQFLSDEEREQIYRGSLEVLKNTGVKVEDSILRKYMLKKGCSVDENTFVVKIEKEIIEECLKDMSKKPVINCLNGKKLELYGNSRYYGSLVVDPFILDYKQGMKKPVLSDVIKNARLGDALPLIDSIHKMDGVVSDVDPRFEVLKTTEALVSNTTTSLHCSPSTVNDLKIWVDMCEIMAGGSLHDNPILCAYVPIITPLICSKENGEQLRYCIDKGVLVKGGPCPIAGATAPFTIAGTLVLSFAEILFQVVAVQSVKKGAAYLAYVGGHPIDLRTGRALYGGPVKDLIHCGAHEMLEYLDIPTIYGIFSSLSPSIGIQSGIEFALAAVFTYFQKSNLMHGMGSFGNACGMSSEIILIHHDIIETIKRYEKGIDVSEEMLALESIEKAGPGGNYLVDGLTLKYMKTKKHYLSVYEEIYSPNCECKTMLEKIHERVEEIILSHEPAVNMDRVEKVKAYVSKKVRETTG